MSELEYLIPLDELSWEYNAFHSTNPFASDVEELQRLSVHVERVTDDLNASMFLDDVMSDNVSNVEQNLQIAQASQPNSSRASLVSANPEEGTAVNLSSVWPPLNTSQIASGDWPNSNRELATSSNIREWVENMSVGITLGNATPEMGLEADPQDSGAPAFGTGRDTEADTAVTPVANQLGKHKTRKEVNFPNYAFATPPPLDPNALRLDRTGTFQHSKSGSIASSSSTIARGIKETEAIKEDFRQSMAQLEQLQTKLTQENNAHTQRAEVLVMEVEELKEGMIEIQMKGRVSQSKLESSIETINDLIRQREVMAEKRVTEMTAIMAQSDQQADERLKQMSEMMHRRDMDIDKRMVNLMTTNQDLTLGMKAVVATMPNRPSPVPVAMNAVNVPSTSTFPTQRPTYGELVQRQSTMKPNHTNQPKLQPPASYKKAPAKAQPTRADTTDMKIGDISGPPSFDPYAKGVSTTGDYYSAASYPMTSKQEYETATEGTEFYTAASNPATKRPMLSSGGDQLRPLASSTQRKTASKRILNLEPTQGAAKGNTPNTIHGQALAEAITTAMSKGLEPLLAAKEVKNKPTKYRSTRDGIIDGWLMLMKRYLQKAHTKDSPLDKAWTRVEFLENEARDYITNKSEAERDTDEKVFALLARRFGTGSNKIQVQQRFRTRNQSNDEDYMQ